MKRTLLVILLTAMPSLSQATWHMKASATIQDGIDGGAIVCGDADNDGLPDFTFWRGTPHDAWLWEVREYRSYGRFDVVQSETCFGNPYPDTGIHKGMFVPTAIGDLDSDGRCEYVGGNTLWTSDSTVPLVCVYEATGSLPEQYPDSLVWMYPGVAYGYGGRNEWLPGDMDRDGNKEIVFTDEFYTYIFENSANNHNRLAFQSPLHRWGYDYAFGDFDQDGATEFAFAPPDPDYGYVYECTGDDQYALVDSFLQPYGRNGYDVFSGNDVDGDGKPEFFIKYDQYDGSISNYRLLMYEATGDNQYEATEIDSEFGVSGWPDACGSFCADIDGDGTEEVVVTYDFGVRVLKAVGNNQFQREWLGLNQSSNDPQTHLACYDMNGNGYKDIVMSGNNRTWMYEMEGNRVLAPNLDTSLVPGDTFAVRWRLFTPPRCDSVSLFLRTDSTWNLDTIATGIAPTESTYSWVVPAGPRDSCRIVAIAYGPGWLFDESDSTFSILAGGCNEEQGAGVRNWALWVWPNPVTANACVRFDVPRQAEVDLSVLDACGRVVRTLASGELAAGSYQERLDAGAVLPAGVYIVRLEAAGRRMSRKVVLTGTR